MRPYISDASDYACFESPKFKAYYGSQAIDPETEEWTCTITKNNKEVARYTNSELLMVANGESPTDMLIAGLALYLCK